METAVFSTMREFRKEYKELRNEIISRHQVDPSKKVKLVRAVALQQKFDNDWLTVTSVKTDMEESIRKYEGRNASFRLVPLV